MIKKIKVGIVSATVLAATMVAGSGASPQPITPTNPSIPPAEKVETPMVTKVDPVCDGNGVTTDCTVEGVSYRSYVYRPAVAQKTHDETVTAYEKQITSTCTLCNDGTYSPSCATGRGACSHHGGVQEWNAPRYANVPVTTTKTIVDAPAREAYYEKVLR